MLTNHYDPKPAQTGWRALRKDRALSHLSAACLPLRQRAGECRACRAACPVDALLMTAEGLALHADCLGCGRCAPACPMGALDLPGSRPVVAGDAATVLRVDCQRVTATLRAEASVPCLGALDAAALLELRVHAGERPIELADRGWCGSCPAGGIEHPVQAALKTAHALLAEMQVPCALWPRLVNMPLPASAASPGIAGVGGEEAMSRRAFFGRVTRPVRQSAVEPAPDSPIRSLAAVAHPSLSRKSLVTSLSALAARRDQPLPSSPYPRITASVRCHDHQGCVRVCPTGALRAYREGDAGGVRFDPAACIACGLCERHCPEQALTVSSAWSLQHPADPVHAMVFTQVTELTRHALQECSACGSAYGVSPGETDTGLCDPCGKSRRLARDTFQQFFGARP